MKNIVRISVRMVGSAVKESANVIMILWESIVELGSKKMLGPKTRHVNQNLVRITESVILRG